MVQSVVKVLDILELLAEEPERRRMLGEITGRTGLGASGAAKILQTLAARGYVVQEARRKGYRLGPMVEFLGRGAAHRGDLTTVAEPLVRRLARKVLGIVSVVTICQGRALVLCEEEGVPGARLTGEPAASRDEVYRSVAVRLLLAYQSAEEVRRFVANHGLPQKETWPEATTEEGLKAALAKTKGQRAALVQTADGMTGFGVPLGAGEKLLAALGVYVPTALVQGGEAKRIVLAIREASVEICGKLTERAAGKEMGKIKKAKVRSNDESHSKLGVLRYLI